MEKVITRPATKNDLETLRSFEQGVIKAERPYDPMLKAGHIFYYELEDMINSDDTALVVAEVNDTIIAAGYARIEESKPYYKNRHFAYLGFMYVLPAYRGKGINKLIMEALQKWALSKNIIELRLQVYTDNAPAIRAYEKIGFAKSLVEMRLELKKENMD